MLRKFKNDMVLDMSGILRPMTELEKEWDEKVRKTFQETKGKARILDPFKGWIEKK